MIEAIAYELRITEDYCKEIIEQRWQEILDIIQNQIKQDKENTAQGIYEAEYNL